MSDRVRAKWRFVAENEGDISMEIGDVVQVIESTNDTNAWWTGRNCRTNETGLFPANYTEKFIPAPPTPQRVKTPQSRPSSASGRRGLGFIGEGSVVRWGGEGRGGRPKPPRMAEMASRQVESKGEESPFSPFSSYGDSSRYKVLRCLGKGSYSSVYLARRNRSTKRANGGEDLVCIKKIYVNTIEQINSAIQEATTMCKANHCAGVCKYYDCYIESEDSEVKQIRGNMSFCLVVELSRSLLHNPNPSLTQFHTARNDNSNPSYVRFCEGGTLQDVIDIRKQKKLGPFAETSAMGILYEIAKTVAELHRLKILHRDLKPSNIFLTRSGKIRIGDFGVAKDLINQRHTGTFVGTTGYIAPEVWNMRPYDNKCDVWSLGVLMLEMLTLSNSSSPRVNPSLPYNLTISVGIVSLMTKISFFFSVCFWSRKKEKKTKQKGKTLTNVQELEKLRKSLDEASLSETTWKILPKLLSSIPKERPSAYRISRYIRLNYPIKLEERLQRVMREMDISEDGMINLKEYTQFLEKMSQNSGKAGKSMMKPEEEARAMLEKLGGPNGPKNGIPVAKFLEFATKFYDSNPRKLALMEICLDKVRGHGSR
ncbi:hypothetical protein AAMO2058_000009600 [Amorphochlora amoebiformis]